ncbi:MAG: hypothetical protein PVF15_00705 [Candidatus Bathyarchaeota archaeon]
MQSEKVTKKSLAGSNFKTKFFITLLLGWLIGDSISFSIIFFSVLKHGKVVIFEYPIIASIELLINLFILALTFYVLSKLE